MTAEPRPDHIRRVLRAAARLVDEVPGVVAVGLAGSWARNAGRPDSDIDLVVLTTAPDELLGRTEWFALFDPAAVLIRCADFGAVQERRLALGDGTVVEVGIATPDWATARPVDRGTYRVVADGWAIVADPDGMLASLVSEVARSTPS